MPDPLFTAIIATIAALLMLALLVLLFPGWAWTVFYWVIDRPSPDAGASHTPLPPGAAMLATSGLDRPLPVDLVGVILAVGVGGFGLNQLLSMLLLFVASGLEQLIGAVLIIECDAQERERFQRRCPSVFATRITYGFTAQYGGGFSNKSTAWVLDRVQEWGVPIVQATEAALDSFLRRNQGRTPQLLWVFATLGGHAPLTLPVLDIFQRRLDGSTLTIVATALPRHGRLRERFVELKPAFAQRGVGGTILTDNLGVDPTTADYALAALPLSLSVAAAFADQPSALNNVLALALSEAADGILIYEVVATTAVAWAVPDASGPSYYTLKDLVTVPVSRMLDQLAAGSGQWSTALPAYELGTSTFDLVMANLTPTFLKQVQDEVIAGRKLRQTLIPTAATTQTDQHPPRFGGPNHDLLFAPVPAPVDPEKPACMLVATRIASVRGANELMPEIVKAPADRLLPSPAGSKEVLAVTDQLQTRRNSHVAG